MALLLIVRSAIANDEPLSVEEYLEHYGRKGMKWGKNLFETEYEPHPREKGEEEEETGNRKGPSEEKLSEVNKRAENKKKSEEITNQYANMTPGTNMGKEDQDKIIEKEKKRKAEAASTAIAENVISNIPGLNMSKADQDKIIEKAKMRKKSEEITNQYANMTPGMNNKPENQNNNDHDNTHGLKSREKYITGTGKKIEKHGEGLSIQSLKQDHPCFQNYSQEFLTTGGFADAVNSINNVIQVARDSELGGTAKWNNDDNGNTRLDIINDFPNYYSNLPKDFDWWNDEDSVIYRAYDDIMTVANNLTNMAVYMMYESPDTVDNDFTSFLDDFVKSNPEFWYAANCVYDYFFGGSRYSKTIDDPTIKHSEESQMDDILEHAEKEGGKTVREVFDSMSDEQQSLVFYFLKKARQLIDDGEIKHSEKEEDEMKHNVFDDAKETKENTLSHADMEKLEADVFKDAKSKGSLKDAFLAHADDYGIDNIEWLFPEDRNLNNPPAWIKRPDGWVSKVMKGVHHSPFSRIKSVFADITEPDARARGYMKGNRKVEEVFGLLKRSTSPTTVYKKQKLDRDDIIDITDFDVVSWLKTEMRGMLDEELARAFLIGDGRSPASNDKINEQNIRPIWTDDDLFVIHKAIAVTSSTTTDDKCKQFIRSAIKARKDYKGSGNPTLYTTDDIVSDLMLMEDQIGHPLYETMEKLTAKLRVKEIVTVPVMENLTRISGTMTFELMGIIVNLDDYNVGADKGGAVSMFEDFDIDYNQEKYLIETRCSGALTKPYSAIVIESTSSIYLDVDPDDPTETRYSKAVSTLQSDVVVNDDSIGGTLKYVTGYTGYSEDTDLQSGNYLSLAVSAPSGATTTIKMVNNGGINETEETLSNDYYVAYVKSKNAKIIVTTTLSGVSVTKTYSLRLLKLEKA